MSHTKFSTFQDFMSFMQNCYQEVASTCQALFDKYNVSETESQITEICEAPLNLYNSQMNASFQNMDDGAKALECYIYDLRYASGDCHDKTYTEDEIANFDQNAYAEGLLANSVASANSILPYPEFASVYCPTVDDPVSCKQEMSALNRQGVSDCNGYVSFGNEDFTSGASNLTGNMALLFVGAHALGQAIGWVNDYFAKPNEQNERKGPKLSA